jgi:hypothetical protein
MRSIVGALLPNERPKLSSRPGRVPGDPPVSLEDSDVQK